MIKLGFIGIGYWGPNLLRNFGAMPDDVQVHTICDIDPLKLNSIKKAFPHSILTTSFDEVIKNNELDAVVLATPVRNHFSFAKKTLEAEKDVFVEKPLAMKRRECEQLIKLSERKKRIIFVGHTFLYNSAVNETKRYLDKGQLGDVYYIYSQRLNLGRARQDIDVIWNLAPHDISIITYFLKDEPKTVSARGFCYLRKGIADIAFITLEFANRVSAHIHVSWLDPNKVRRVTIVGSKKMLVYDDVEEDAKIKIYDKGIDKRNINKDLGRYDNFEKFLFIHRSGNILIPKLNFEEPLRIETRHFIDCLKKRKAPLTDGYNGLKVVKIIEAAEKSLKTNSSPINL